MPEEVNSREYPKMIYPQRVVVHSREEEDQLLGLNLATEGTVRAGSLQDITEGAVKSAPNESVPLYIPPTKAELAAASKAAKKAKAKE